MRPSLKIQIATPSSPSRVVNNNKVEEIFGRLLENMIGSINVDLEISICQNRDAPFLVVNNFNCRYSESLVKEVDSYINFLEEINGASSTEDLYWELLISNIIWLQPYVLFPKEYLSSFFSSYDLKALEGSHKFEEKFKEIIEELLNLKINLSNKPLIAQISGKYLNQQNTDWSSLREELIDSVSIREIGIYFNPDYFNDMIAVKSNDNYFELMRDGLFYETGIKFPPFKIVFDSSLPYNAIFFRINAYTSIPVIGIFSKNEILVNDASDNLILLGVTGGKETINPANGNKATIINKEFKKKVEDAGLITWDCLGYFILCFSSFLRKNGYLCIDKSFTLQQMESLRVIFHKIIDLFVNGELLPLSIKVLRLLAKEGISIRNLPFILDAILESDYIIADGHKNIIFDERIPVTFSGSNGWKNNAENVVEFVRIRLKQYLSNKFIKGQSSLKVYLLDPKIEMIVDPYVNVESILEDETRNKIINAVHETVKETSSFEVPIILTTVNVRIHMKKVIEIPLPHVAVLSYQELSSEVNIQVLDRIYFIN